MTFDEIASTFGGCTKLCEQYQTVGRSLINYEENFRSYSYASFAAFSEFRESVVFIPTNVLGSYLEDLLNLDFSEERLFIRREKKSWRSAITAYLGMAVAVAIGLSLVAVGYSTMVSFAVTILSGGPFIYLWHITHDKSTRRMRFARVVSRELSRRRGHGEEDQEIAAATDGFGISDLIGGQARSSNVAAKAAHR